MFLAVYTEHGAYIVAFFDPSNSGIREYKLDNLLISKVEGELDSTAKNAAREALDTWTLG